MVQGKHGQALCHGSGGRRRKGYACYRNIQPLHKNFRQETAGKAVLLQATINKRAAFNQKMQQKVWRNKIPTIYDNRYHTHRWIGKAGTPTGETHDLITYWFHKYGLPKIYRKTGND